MPDNFDRFINIKLIGPAGIREIPTFRDGVKQEISVSGTFLPGAFATNIELRVANLYGIEDFATFKTIEIEAGYYGPSSNLNGDQITKGTIRGQLSNAFKESPGPDGITVFQIIVGEYITGVFAKPFVAYAAAKTTMGSFLSNLISGHNKANPDTTWTVSVTNELSSTEYPIEYNAEFLTLKEHLDKIQDVMRHTLGTSNPWSSNLGFYFTTEGTNLNCFFGGERGSGRAKKVVYVSSPPRNEGGHFSFTAPWDPSIRVNDLLSISNNFARQSYGGGVVAPTGGPGTTEKSVFSISFDFSTTQNTNKMNVQCLYTGQDQ